MSNIDANKIIQKIDFDKIENEKKNGKSLEEILNGIDLRPIVREEMVKISPNVEEKDIDNAVREIDLAKIVSGLLTKESSFETITGGAFEDLSVEDMMALQGAGDVDVEISPTVSSCPCLAAISAVGGAILSYVKC